MIRKTVRFIFSNRKSILTSVSTHLHRLFLSQLKIIIIFAIAPRDIFVASLFEFKVRPFLSLVLHSAAGLIFQFNSPFRAPVSREIYHWGNKPDKFAAANIK